MPRVAYNLRSKDVAMIIDCSPDDVYDLVEKGEIKGLKKGRFWRFNLDSVMLYKRRLARRKR